MTWGRRAGFGTLLYQSLQFPEPGSWTIHIPEMSVAPCAAAGTHQRKNEITMSARIISIEREGIERISSGHQYVLAAVDHVGLRSVCYLADVAVPQNLSVRRIESNQVP